MKRFVSGTVAAVLAVVMLAACASSGGGSASLSFKPGTYTATKPAHNGALTVETVFGASRIESVKITKQIESPGVQQVINVVPERIVAMQSLAVDTVTGASICGKATIAAVTDCVKQAGGDVAALTKPLPKAEVKPASYEADVIVIGAGGSGLAAAVAAHQSGAKVIVVEKLGFPGGSTIFSDGALNAADPQGEATLKMSEGNKTTIREATTRKPHDDFEAGLQKTVADQFAKWSAANSPGLFDSPEWHMLQTYNGGDYEGRPELIKTLAANALANVKWMADLGAVWRPNLGSATGSLWQRSHYGQRPEFPNGLHSVMPYKKYVESHDNIEIQYDTKAEELIVTGGRITGVKATHLGAAITYTAKKGVIMATGGFGANIQMRVKYNTLWDDLGPDIGTSNHRMAAQGDGIVMGEKVGAQLEDMGLIQLHPSGEKGTGIMLLHPGSAGLNRIFVDGQGRRFVAEDARRDVMIKAIQKLPGSTMWVVADRARYAPDDPLIVQQVENGKALKADTLEELAQKMGVPYANLKASIDQYNADVDGAKDPFGLRTVDKKMGVGPFYAVQRVPTVHHTMGGLLIDSSARVLDKNGRPIPGFYAAGEVTGGIHGTNRLGGNALADCTVFGKIAGISAAGGK